MVAAVACDSEGGINMTPAGWFIAIPLAWLIIVGLAALWLRARERSREIDEHTDRYWSR